MGVAAEIWIFLSLSVGTARREAVAMAAAGINDILLSNEVVARKKII